MNRLKACFATILLTAFTSVLLAPWASHAGDLGYRYKDGRCMGPDNQTGLNPGYIGQCGDFRNVILARFNLEGADLSGSSFEGADLQETSLAGANLSGVNFSTANLAGVEFRRAKLHGANLTAAILINTHLVGAEIKASNFARANFAGAHLGWVNLAGNSFVQANFTGANLEHANFSASDLSEAVFTQAILQRAVLAGANLTRSNFSLTDLTGADLSKVTANGGVWRRAYLRDANLEDAVLTNVDLRAAQMDRANLTRANLEKSDLRAAVLKDATVTNTIWTGVMAGRSTVLPFSSEVAKDLGIVMSMSGTILILWDTGASDPDLLKLKEYLEGQGALATISQKPVAEFDGSEALESYSAVLHLAGQSDRVRGEIPEKGQDALVSFVNNGGTYIGTEWISFLYYNRGSLKKMRDLILITRNRYFGRMLSFSPATDKANHPLLLGVTGPISLYASYTLGKLASFTNNPAESIMKSTDGSDIVTARTLGAGKVVNFAFTGGNYNSDQHVLANPDVQKLILNAANW